MTANTFSPILRAQTRTKIENGKKQMICGWSPPRKNPTDRLSLSWIYGNYHSVSFKLSASLFSSQWKARVKTQAFNASGGGPKKCALCVLLRVCCWYSVRVGSTSQHRLASVWLWRYPMVGGVYVLKRGWTAQRRTIGSIFLASLRSLNSASIKLKTSPGLNRVWVGVMILPLSLKMVWR